jgi:DnaK suppressor protein
MSPETSGLFEAGTGFAEDEADQGSQPRVGSTVGGFFRQGRQKVDLQVARTRLEALLAELDESAQVLQQTGDPADTGELSTVDQHPADYASNVVDADREEASVEVVLAQRDRVREALQRVDNGTYGRCLTCGEPIPDERLEAMPEAERDVKHQQEFEAGR